MTEFDNNVLLHISSFLDDCSFKNFLKSNPAMIDDCIHFGLVCQYDMEDIYAMKLTLKFMTSDVSLNERLIRFLKRKLGRCAILKFQLRPYNDELCVEAKALELEAFLTGIHCFLKQRKLTSILYNDGFQFKIVLKKSKVSPNNKLMLVKLGYDTNIPTTYKEFDFQELAKQLGCKNMNIHAITKTRYAFK